MSAGSQRRDGARIWPKRSVLPRGGWLPRYGAAQPCPPSCAARWRL